MKDVQRLYEVKGKTNIGVIYITPEMMSDEEKVVDKWIRHLLSYRFELFTKFIRKRDNRCSSSTHARFPRGVGSPALKDPPTNCKNWLLSQFMGNTSTSDPGQESEELFSANEAI